MFLRNLSACRPRLRLTLPCRTYYWLLEDAETCPWAAINPYIVSKKGTKIKYSDGQLPAFPTQTARHADYHVDGGYNIYMKSMLPAEARVYVDAGRAVIKTWMYEEWRTDDIEMRSYVPNRQHLIDEYFERPEYRNMSRDQQLLKAYETLNGQNMSPCSYTPLFVALVPKEFEHAFCVLKDVTGQIPHFDRNKMSRLVVEEHLRSGKDWTLRDQAKLDERYRSKRFVMWTIQNKVIPKAQPELTPKYTQSGPSFSTFRDFNGVVYVYETLEELRRIHSKKPQPSGTRQKIATL